MYVCVCVRCGRRDDSASHLTFFFFFIPFLAFTLPSAVISAAVKGHAPAVKELLSAGALPNNANNAGTTALHWAALEGHIQVVKELLAKGAKPDVKDCNGRTALSMSEDRRHRDVSALLQRAINSAGGAADAAFHQSVAPPAQGGGNGQGPAAGGFAGREGRQS